MVNGKYSKKELEELTKLLNDWDPIGVLPLEGGPQDEYECLIEPILDLLERGVRRGEFVQFLVGHLQKHMGLKPQYIKPEKFVNAIIKWWDKH